MNPITAAAQARAECLAELRRKADRGDTDCLPWLIARTEQDPRLLAIHVWMVDQAVFGATRFVARRHVAQAHEWCRPLSPGGRKPRTARRQHPFRPATATLGWLLDGRTGGARLTAWLLAVGLGLGFRLDPPDPYSHGQAGDDRADGTPRADIPAQ